jgi:cell division control protein 12
VDFLDDQHENFMRQEQQPHRNEKVDMRVHACIYFITPNGHSFVPFPPFLLLRECRAELMRGCRLKPLDIETMKRLGTRVNLIPVIAKADTMTPQDIIAFKENVSPCRFLIPSRQELNSVLSWR